MSKKGRGGPPPYSIDRETLEDQDRATPAPPEAQTGIKEGVHSSAKKQQASRPEWGPKPGANPVPGAFGNPAKVKTTRGSANWLTDSPPAEPAPDQEENEPEEPEAKPPENKGE